MGQITINSNIRRADIPNLMFLFETILRGSDNPYINESGRIFDAGCYMLIDNLLRDNLLIFYDDDQPIGVLAFNIRTYAPVMIYDEVIQITFAGLIGDVVSNIKCIRLFIKIITSACNQNKIKIFRFTTSNYKINQFIKNCFKYKETRTLHVEI